MPDNTFRSTEMFNVIQELATSDSWDSTFYLLEQEQAMLLDPEAEAILLAMIERKKQQNTPHEEIDALARYLPLLRDMREYGLPAAWEVFILEARDLQQTREIFNALNALEGAEGLDDLRTIFVEKQADLLTEKAGQVLDFLIQEIEEDSRDPRLRCLRQVRDLLEHASIAGMQRALDENAPFVYDALLADQQFLDILNTWLEISPIREQRSFLKQHLEIVQTHSVNRLQDLIEEYAENEESVVILRDRMSCLNEILQRGGSVRAVRETYVDRAGGLALDIPLWLEEVEARLEILAEQPDQRTEQIALFRETITHASRDATVAPETLATLQSSLGMALRDTLPDDPLYADNLEEALAAQTAALQTFTLARYPIQHTQAQFELGISYMERVKGDYSENLEQALTCHETALQVLNKVDYPLEWVGAQVRLGKIYHERVAGDKSRNLECALAYQESALEIYQRDTYPVEWASIQFSLGLLFVDRIAGEPLDNQQQAIKHFQQTFQVYTHEAFPQDWAISHLTLGAFYTEPGFIGDLKTDRFALALEHYRQAEQVLTAKTFPEEWALIQEGIMLVAIIRMDEHERKYSSLQQAIARGETALLELTRVAQPLAWAGIHTRLSEVYSMSAAYANPQERSDRLEQALTYIKKALQIYTPENNPDKWAYAQRLQGEIYSERTKENRKENLDQAKQCCELALQAINYEVASEEWVRVQIILGAVLLAYPEKRKEDIERAIACFEASLERCHLTTSAVAYARNHICLCQAYVERIEGDHQQNVETAIQHGRAVFQVFTRQNEPVGWAEAQFYLGIAYVKRTAGERRANIEQAILCFEYAEKIFTREQAPFLWAGIQGNLSAVYQERSAGNANQSAPLSMYYVQKALEIYTEENAPREWATLQFRLGIAYQNLMQNATDDAALQAEKHYLMALRSYTNSNDPLNAALIQLTLGGYYQTLVLSGNGAAYKQQALSYYHTALQTFTKETTPIPWAMVQLGLGMILGSVHFDPKSAAIEREQAVRFLQQAMSILTREVFPHEHRRVLNLVLVIEWQRGRWREIARLSQVIHEVEEDLLRTSTGTSGLDKLLAERLNPSPSAMGAFAWLLQRPINQGLITMERGWTQDRARSLALPLAKPEDMEQAAITLERGRAIELARSLARYLAAPERIQNLELRQRYTNALKKLQEARKILAQKASLNEMVSVSLNDRELFLACTADCEAAQRTFEEIIAEIQEARDPADFFVTTVDRDTLQQAVAQGGPGHALVYLVALEDIGGFALAVQAARKPGDAPLQFEPCMLPGLTFDVVHNLVKGGAELDLSSCREKLVPLLLHPLLEWLQKKLKPSSLTLIPCGDLTGLPLSTLLMDEDETLGDKLPTSVVPSALSLLHTQTSDRMRKGVYAFGDPQGDLPFGEAEAHALQDIARQSGLTSYCTVQENVTSRVLENSLKHALVIDLACHGRVNPDDYLQSCLMLARGQRLTLGTILNWQREMQGLRLLILSACQSSAADLKGAVDEVRSLTSAMLQAGARAVLAPLWQVDDRATFLLMTRFATEWFPQMETEPPAAALARAQRWLRNVTNEELKHWEARVLLRSDEELQVTMAEKGKSFLNITSVPVPQKLRSDMHDAKNAIRKDAARNPSDLCPYADPIDWAGFQIVGW